MKTQATIEYNNGWVLVIPKCNNAPLLFMEWLATFNACQCPIHKVIDGSFLSIRLNGTKKDVYESALKYINDNI